MENKSNDITAMVLTGLLFEKKKIEYDLDAVLNNKSNGDETYKSINELLSEYVINELKIKRWTSITIEEPKINENTI